MKLTYTLAILMIFVCFKLSAEVVTAYTVDGREVALFENGTWLYKPQAPSKTLNASSSYTTPDLATTKLTNNRNKYAIWYNPLAWEPEMVEEGENFEFYLKLKGEDAYAITIYERIPIPLGSLAKIALENMKSASETAKITDEKMIKVNGESMVYLRIEALINGIPFVYHGYYTSGDFGTIQFLTFTHTSLEKEYKDSMVSLLNGLRIIEE